MLFLMVNRNKRSVALNIATPEGRALFVDLAARTDVVIEARTAEREHPPNPMQVTMIPTPTMIQP